MRNLLSRLASRHRVLLLASAGLLAGFEFLICAIVANVDVIGALDQILVFAPPALRAMLEQSLLAGGGPSGLLAFGWNHPVAHAVGTAVAITLGARAVAADVESGAIELLLAQPLSRARYLAANMLFGAGAVAAVTLSGVAATLVGEAAFALHGFGAHALARLAAGFFLLQLAWFAIALALSSFGREVGRVGLAAFFLAVASYLVHAVAALWPAAAFLDPWSLHSYYDPRRLLGGGVSSSALVVLGTTIVVGALVATAIFRTRDLP